MQLPVYVITYQCRKCGTTYIGEWNPNHAGHVEPATACPSCGSPVRLFLGVGQRPEAARIGAESEVRPRPRFQVRAPVVLVAARQGAA